jgi:hypothetical protein
MSIDRDLNRQNDDELPLAWPTVESSKGGGTLSSVHRWFDRLVCRYGSHDWWSLAYPPARRWECLRCGVIVEEASSALPDRRRAPRDTTRPAAGPHPD